jgi:hypothetical protein
LAHVLPLIAGGLIAVALPALASGQSPARTSITYAGGSARLSAAAVVSFSQLARVEALRPQAHGPLVPYLLPEPQEKPEPNSTITLPSPFPLLPLTDERSAGVPSPSPSLSFLAQADAPRTGTSISTIPPDTDGAVGTNKLMVTLNNNYVIEDKATGAVLSNVSMPTFWAASGATSPFDPKTRYDPYNNRWIVSAVSEAASSSSSILFGISDTSDPSGTWHLYRFDADSSDQLWADYPAMGFNKNFVAIHVNMFTNAANSFSQGRLLVIGYPALRANSLGTGAGTIGYVTGLPSFTMQPVVTYSSSENTLYAVEHFASASATYRFWTITGLTTATLVGGAAKTNPLGPWSIPAGPVMPQAGGNPIDSGDARVLSAVFRNGGIYYAQTIGLGAGARTAVQWVQLNTSGNFVQGGRIDDPTATGSNGGHWYAFPAISVNSLNDVLVGLSEFQSNDFIDAAYALHAAGDAAGSMRDPVTLKQGEGNYYKTFGGLRNRWGDYSAAQVDPSDDRSFWTIQEYAGTPVGSGDGSGRWSTWWGKIAGVGGAPPPPPPAPPPPPPPPPPPALKPPCVVPKVTGMKLRAATAKLRSRSCRVGKVTYIKSTKRRKGRVIREWPAPRRRLGHNAKVKLWLGKGPRRH